MTLQYLHGSPSLPDSSSAETPSGDSGGQHRSRGHIRGGVSPRGMLADVQAGIGMIQTALLALDESCVLLEKLGVLVEDTAHEVGSDPVRPSSGTPASRSDLSGRGSQPARAGMPAVTDAQGAVTDLVIQLDRICREAVFGDVVVLDGSLAGHRLQMSAAGADVAIDIPALNADVLGLHRPWGRAATGNDPMGSRIASSRGIVPSGVFRLVRGSVIDAQDVIVGVCAGPVLSFTSGLHRDTTVCFDHPVANAGRPGTVCLDGVLSVRTREAAERALTTVATAYEQVNHVREQALSSLRELTDVAIALGVALASAEDAGEFITDRETAADVVQLVRREVQRNPEVAAAATPREAVVRRLLA